jgi:Lysyl oxidase
MRGTWRAGACLLFLGLLLTIGAGDASATAVVGSLKIGESAFWNGAYVPSARVSDPSLCGIQGPCFDYKLDVLSAGAKSLRVAIDTTDDSNGWGIRLLDPSGNEAASGSTYTLGGIAENFDAEVFAHDPKPGEWTVQVIPTNVVEGSFIARAALRAVPKPKPKTSAVVDVPPDLQPDPPWHLTFDQPPPMVVTEGGNYTALLGIHNPTMQIGGVPIYQCLPEETREQGGTKCLRFTSGFASVGPGKFEVYGSSDAPVAADGGPLYQVVYRSDGSSYARPAGRFEFHRIHMHYHVLGIAQFVLYKVDPATHRLTTAGKVLKEGFCLGNIKLFDWHSLDQDEVDPGSVDNCEPSPQPDGTWRFYEGIANGWEDAYKWSTSGQFVDFADQTDGYYVLRLTVNPEHLMLESDYANDTAYTYFQVVGHTVRVIERGHGTDPWDPRKTTVDPFMTH